jgi:hypothetical protein
MSKRKVLLTTVFRPFSVPNKFNLPDDEKFLDYFSNRLTRERGLFVLHDNHPTVAPHLIACNLQSDVTVMETPTIIEFTDELKKGYDVLGISFLTLHFPKLMHMIALARKYAPQMKVVIGGFGTALHDLERLDVDGICHGEGVRFFREFLGEAVDSHIDHPLLTVDVRLRLALGYPALGSRKMGIIVNGFGCPHACEFCSTSAYFGKRHVPFVATGKHLYELMAHYHRMLGIHEFIIYEEDFFLYRRYIDDYLQYFRERPAPFSFACYSTVKALSQYPLEDLVRAGLSHVWIGVESVQSPFNKSNGKPVAELFTELQNHGVTTTGSIIAGLDHQTRKNLPNEFEHLASLFPSTVQISNLIAGPETDLRSRLEREGRLRPDVDIRDSHLYSDIVIHPEFSRGELRGLIFQGYDFIYQSIGPALYRMLATWHQGWKNLHISADPLLQMRSSILAGRVRALAPVFLETEEFLPNDVIRSRVANLMSEIERLNGAWTHAERREAKRISKVFNQEKVRLERDGPFVYEPDTRITYYGEGEASNAVQKLVPQQIPRVTVVDKRRPLMLF